MLHVGTKQKMSYHFIITLFLLCFLKKVFDSELLKTGGAAYLSHAPPLRSAYKNIWNNAVLLYQRMMKVSLLKTVISHLCNRNSSFLQRKNTYEWFCFHKATLCIIFLGESMKNTTFHLLLACIQPQKLQKVDKLSADSSLFWVVDFLGQVFNNVQLNFTIQRSVAWNTFLTISKLSFSSKF